jgi:hypothetical protein
MMDPILRILNQSLHDLEQERTRLTDQLAELDCVLNALKDARQRPLLHQAQAAWLAQNPTESPKNH